MQILGRQARAAAARLRSWKILLSLVVMSLLGTGHAESQVRKVGRPRPRPKLFLFVSLTVNASPTAVTFALVHSGGAIASAPVAVTTAYFLGVSLSGSMTLYAYFSSAANALRGGTPTSSIPSSDVYGLVSTGIPTSYTAFTQSTPYSGASGLALYNQTTLVSLSGSRTDNLNLKIDLAATPQLPAAVYIGTITLEAQAF